MRYEYMFETVYERRARDPCITGIMKGEARVMFRWNRYIRRPCSTTGGGHEGWGTRGSKHDHYKMLSGLVCLSIIIDQLLYFGNFKYSPK